MTSTKLIFPIFNIVATKLVKGPHLAGLEVINFLLRSISNLRFPLVCEHSLQVTDQSSVCDLSLDLKYNLGPMFYIMFFRTVYGIQYQDLQITAVKTIQPAMILV
jgi:hypothetical protein